MRYYLNNTSNAFNDFFEALMPEKGFGYPPMNIYETEEGYVIEANIAGYKDDEVSLAVEKHILSLKAEKEEVEDKREYSLKEITCPSFERAFNLPEDADEKKISAEKNNGILTVKVGKKEEYLGGKVEIKIS